ncbi:MAG: hypothetical protein ACRC1F_02855, partial [Metamycoplasmataceae bacterium]
EDSILKYIDVDLKVNETKLNEIDFQIHLLISTLRLKLLDNSESSDIKKKRGKIKEFVIANKKEANFNFNEKDILGFLKTNFIYKPDSIKDFVKYLLFIKDRYQEILKSDDEEAFKRLRHKNNFYSMPIGHIIEE